EGSSGQGLATTGLGQPLVPADGGRPRPDRLPFLGCMDRPSSSLPVLQSPVPPEFERRAVPPWPWLPQRCDWTGCPRQPHPRSRYAAALCVGIRSGVPHSKLRFESRWGECRPLPFGLFPRPIHFPHPVCLGCQNSSLHLSVRVSLPRLRQPEVRTTEPQELGAEDTHGPAGAAA